MVLWRCMQTLAMPTSQEAKYGSQSRSRHTISGEAQALKIVMMAVPAKACNQLHSHACDDTRQVGWHHVKKLCTWR